MDLLEDGYRMGRTMGLLVMYALILIFSIAVSALWFGWTLWGVIRSVI
ncbi:MAG: hypothetical protein V1856_03045 [Candidatus Liptonbacteria bacterium]